MHLNMSYCALQVFVHVSSSRVMLLSGLGILEEAHYMDVCAEGSSAHLSTAFSAPIPPASSNNAWFGEE